VAVARRVNNTRGDKFASPLHTTKADGVAEWIRARILSGELVPGTSLQQEELAHQLDVSSTPVREAILTLEAEGYVERRPHRGAVVTQPPYGEIEEIREVRNAMDRLAVSRICASNDPDLLTTLHDVMENSRSALAALDRLGWQRSAYEVHHAIALASGSKAILDVSNMLIARERRNLPVYEETMRRAHQTHEELMLALDSRDRSRALACLDEHNRIFHDTVTRARSIDEGESR
jgi:DNA-binding GntR family transcriptional regulator